MVAGMLGFLWALQCRTHHAIGGGWLVKPMPQLADSYRMESLILRPTQRNVLPTIQIVRGFAALLVVVGHTLLETSRLTGTFGKSLPIPLYGFGVDVFFVLSGFIMIYTAGSTFGSARAGSRFTIARILRIVPLYWTLMMVMLIVLTVAPSAFSQPFPNISQALGSLFFIPVRTAGGEILPLLTVGWTLNYEMFFYAAFALALTRSRRSGVLALLLLLTGLAMAGATLNPQNALANFWTNSIIVEFGFGVLVGLVASNLKQLNRSAAFGLLVCGVAIYIAEHYVSIPFARTRFLASGFPAVLIVMGAVSMDLGGTQVRNRMLERLGDSSYSLYLSHLFIVRLTRVAWNAVGVTSPSIVYVIITVALAVILAFSLAALYELPLQRYLKRRSSGLFLATTSSLAHK